MIKCKVYDLAHLAARRDMGMLGIIHRSVLGPGPEHVHEFFVQTGVVFQTAGVANEVISCNSKHFETANIWT